MCSSGIRAGAFDFLNIGDIRPYERDGKLACGMATVYADEGDDQYETLISKEAYLMFREYVQVRRARGENVTDSSPAIVIRSGQRRCGSNTISGTINTLLWKCGLRTEKKKRHEFAADHGLRKFYDNVAKNKIDESYVEKLIGHDTGAKEHYDRHIPEPAVEQYLMAMPYLSIDQVYRVETELAGKLRKKEEELDVRYNELRIDNLEKTKALEEMKEKVESTRADMAKIVAYLENGAKVDPALLQVKKGIPSR